MEEHKLNTFVRSNFHPIVRCLQVTSRRVVVNLNTVSTSVYSNVLHHISTFQHTALAVFDYICQSRGRQVLFGVAPLVLYASAVNASQAVSVARIALGMFGLYS